MFSFSRFPRRYGIKVPGAEEEVMEGRDVMKDLWMNFSSKAICYQLLGNHSVRLHKRIMETLPQISGIFNIKQLFEYKNVKTLHDERVPLELGGVLFQHGHKSKLGSHSTFNLQSTVVGHTHKAGIVYFPFKDQLIYEMNVGYLADPYQEPLMYRESKVTNWTHALGFIDEYGPRIINL